MTTYGTEVKLGKNSQQKKFLRFVLNDDFNDSMNTMMRLIIVYQLIRKIIVQDFLFKENKFIFYPINLNIFFYTGMLGK